MADVLVVDDSPFIQTMLAALCEPEGWTVKAVGSLAAARTVLATSRPRMVMLDYHLPDGYGPDLVPELRAMDPEPFVIALSMQPRAHVRNRFGSREVHMVMDKEVILRSDLVDILRSHLGPGPAAEQPAAPASEA